jgi:DNA-binding beta-propeller fold protein YncE
MRALVQASFLALAAAVSGLPAGAQTSSAPAARAPLSLVRAIELPAAYRGSFDHLAVDRRRQRLFLTPEAQHTVLVVDLRSGKVVDRIAGVGKPHAVFYRSDLDELFVTDGADGSLRVFDGETYRPSARIALHEDADSIGYDPSTHDLYVDNGGKGAGEAHSFVSVVDTTSNRHLADIEIPSSTLEAMALDAYRPRLYVNDAADNTVVVVDRWTRKPIATWPVTLGEKNVAIALDEPHERLFVGCRSGKVVVFNSTTGRELSAFPTVSQIDDLAFDPATRRLYAAGDGAVAVYQERDADHVALLERVPTGRHAKTGHVISEQNAYVTVVPAHGERGPSVLVYRMDTQWKNPNPSAPFAYAPDAPAAERLVMSTLSSHPYLRKLGLHGIKPGESVSVLLANGNQTRLGIRTTAGDFAAVASARQYAPLIPDADAPFYNVKLPLWDARGRRIGLIVMEIPSSAARDYHDAIAKADAIRSEVSAQIPDLASLFARG